MNPNEPLEPPPLDQADKPFQNRLLSIDGGGMRGFISIAILEKLEHELSWLYNDYYENREDFRLSHYFNFIGGTSVGSIIASMLSMGASMAEVKQFFDDSYKAMFPRSLAPTRRKFTDRKLRKKLKAIFQQSDGGPDRLFGDPDLETYLMLVLRNASTGSTWPLVNNPELKYNQIDRRDCNLFFPLWKLVRASTAAPTYFPVERLRFLKEVNAKDLDKRHLTTDEFEFIDGGVSTDNNPAFAMFLQATLPENKMNMADGVANMLLVSVGTGDHTPTAKPGEVGNFHLIQSAKFIVGSLMHSCEVYQDILCRLSGDYRNRKVEPNTEKGDPWDDSIDRLLGRLTSSDSDQKRFTYFRFNPKFTDKNLQDYRKKYLFRDAFSLDATKAKDLYYEIGKTYAERAVARSYFDDFAGALWKNKRRGIVKYKPDASLQVESLGDHDGLRLTNAKPTSQKIEVVNASIEKKVAKPFRHPRHNLRSEPLIPLILTILCGTTLWLGLDRGWFEIPIESWDLADGMHWRSFRPLPVVGFLTSSILTITGFCTTLSALVLPRRRMIGIGLIGGTIFSLAAVALIMRAGEMVTWLTLIPAVLGCALLLGSVFSLGAFRWRRRKLKWQELSEPGMISESGIAVEPDSIEEPKPAVLPAPVKMSEEAQVPEPVEPAIPSASALVLPREVLPITLPDSDIKMLFEPIPKGKFRMGSREREDEQPIRLVEIPHDFYLGRFPVTQEQFACWTQSKHYKQWLANHAEMKDEDEHKNHFKGENLPAEQLNWWEAQAFCQWLNESGQMEPGWVARLPDEAHWEYACRGEVSNDGSIISSEYFTGDGAKALGQAGWYDGNTESTQPVGGKLPNHWGLYDMHGNVWEWCNDLWDSSAYLQDYSYDTGDALENTSNRVMRGGSWGGGAAGCRSAYRSGNRPGFRNGGRGFRVACFPESGGSSSTESADADYSG